MKAVYFIIFWINFKNIHTTWSYISNKLSKVLKFIESIKYFCILSKNAMTYIRKIHWSISYISDKISDKYDCHTDKYDFSGNLMWQSPVESNKLMRTKVLMKKIVWKSESKECVSCSVMSDSFLCPRDCSPPIFCPCGIS